MKRMPLAVLACLVAYGSAVGANTNSCPAPHHDGGFCPRVEVQMSHDPNEMSGPSGAGDVRYVKAGEWMDYTIYFENMTGATAAAQEIRVALGKDPALDWGTLELGEMAFGEHIDTGLARKAKGESSYRLAESDNEVRTTVKATDAEVMWYLRSWDPKTADHYPEDFYAGILPPNDETGCGEGYLRYRVKVREDAVPGTVIRASASIVFDENPAIETDPAWWNTVATVEGVTLVVGEGESVPVEAIVGAPWGDALPVLENRGANRFGGWWTGPNGTGTEVTSNTVATAGTTKLYAFWDSSLLPELWMDISWGNVVLGPNGVESGYGLDGTAIAGFAARYMLTGTSTIHGVRFSGGKFTNTWTNLCVELDAKDKAAVALAGASVEVTLEGDNFAASGEDCAGVRVDEKSVLVLSGPGRLMAQGGAYGAGIGGGLEEKNGRVEIRGGTVEACAGAFGAGIGGGLVGSGADVVITGGSVKARGKRGMNIGSGYGEANTKMPIDGMGATVHEVEVPLATDTLPVVVVVDLGGGRTYRYEGMGHKGDSSLWFWLPDGTYEFAADGDDYGVHVAGEGTSAIFTDPGHEHFAAPPVGGVSFEDGMVRAGMNPAYRTSPFEVWTATGLEGATWNWRLLPPAAYTYDKTNAIIRIPDDTNRMRMLRVRFLP